ncbi:hypothetical protein OEZ85_003453 [Tetradesmus obliquus]|uniref:Uncharacterized protein n=1 Tax=Tetradesmus obliquus TaxID=3088 RepID=A0ABY8UGH7_TETOB|nr:hypothetical protein OEZ85_003453 [Tetradesmus obliquus]
MDDDVLEQLAAVTRLQSLSLSSPEHDVTGLGMLHLTRLTGLTHLSIDGYDEEGWAKGALDEFEDCRIKLTSEASPPDVWQQLRDLCRRNIDCLENLLEEQEALVKQQARQLQQQALLIQGAQTGLMQLEQQ